VRTRETTTWGRLHRIWLRPVLALAMATALFLFSTFIWDWYLNRPETMAGLGPLDLLFHYDAETLQNALGNLAQTVAAVLGIVCTVVAIVVQLAATRYTPRVTDLFFKERTNFFVLGFFVVACVSAIWVSLSVSGDFVPRISVVVSVLAVTLSLFLMVPYFVFVFDFLDPENIISRIQVQAFAATSNLDRDVTLGQDQLLNSVEQLADLALNATAQQDKIISARAVDALRVLLVRYTHAKQSLPNTWFDIGPTLGENPDFQAMNADALQDLISERMWVEWKVLRQYQTIYNEALDANPDMNYLIAINTRYLGEAILAGGGASSLRLVIKFFNTYMRATLNKRQVRTAYNILNQYRQLVEAIILTERQKLTEDAAGYLRYYGQVASGMGLGFVTETIAYDLAALCELAHRNRSTAHDLLLGALLDLDKEAEDEAQEATLRGVRKAQVRLATYYLLHDDEGSARRIYQDMEDERPHRLESIRDELLRVDSKDFWEVIDRGANFDYMDENRKDLLADFFSWFKEVPPSRKSARLPRGPLAEKLARTSERLQQADQL
jgi:hypothetical protein